MTISTVRPGASDPAPNGDTGPQAHRLRLVEHAIPDPAATNPPAILTGHSTVAILGLGYVGLPTALAMLRAGLRVVGIDVSEARLSAIRARRVDLIDTDHERLELWLGAPELVLTSDPDRLRVADVVIICVPTPVDEHRLPDLEALKAACATVVSRARAGQTILLTSTTYVGSTRELVVEPLRARGFTPGQDIFVAFAPERIDPGNVRYPQEVVPRVVGGYSPECTARAAAVIERVAPVERVSSPEVAELTKLYENTFRAVNIALANEFETVSHHFGIDISEVIRAASSKPFGFMPFYPGTGVGGHCIPCDPHYLLWQLRAMKHEAPVIEHAMTSIARRPIEMVDRMASLLAERGLGLRDRRVIVVGAAYKSGVEDVRESPGLEVIIELRRRGAVVDYHDPLVAEIRLEDGSRLVSVDQPDGADYDAALIHVIQPGVNMAWLERCDLVVDPGGRVRRRELVAIPVSPRDAVAVPVGSDVLDEAATAS